MSGDLGPHARVPELLDVAGDLRNGAVVPLHGEERRDLIGHHHELFDLHTSGAVYQAGLQGRPYDLDAATWRLLIANSSYSFWYRVGPDVGATCTAVTLYSGQLVAQSLYSVVTTLAPVAGS